MVNYSHNIVVMIIVYHNHILIIVTKLLNQQKVAELPILFTVSC